MLLCISLIVFIVVFRNSLQIQAAFKDVERCRHLALDVAECLRRFLSSVAVGWNSCTAPDEDVPELWQNLCRCR